MSNKLLAGLQGAQAIANLYFGFADREDKRRQFDANMDYQKSRDTVKDQQWQTSHEFDKTRHTDDMSHKRDVLAETRRSRQATNALGWANHNLSARKYYDALARDEAERESDIQLINMANGFGGAIGGQLGLKDGVSLNTAGRVSGIHDDEIVGSIGEGKLVQNSGNAGALISRETGFNPKNLGINSDDVRVDMVKNGDGTFGVITSFRNGDGGITTAPVVGADKLTPAQVTALYENSEGVKHYLTDSANIAGKQAAENAKRQRGTFGATQPIFDRGAQKTLNPAYVNSDSSKAGSASATLASAVAAAPAATNTVLGTDHSLASIRQDAATASSISREQQAVAADERRVNAAKNDLAQLASIAKTGGASARKQAIGYAEAIRETGLSLADGAVEVYSEMLAKKDAEAKGRAQAWQDGAKNAASVGNQVSWKDINSFGKEVAQIASDNVGKDYKGKAQTNAYNVVAYLNDGTTLTEKDRGDPALKTMSAEVAQYMTFNGIEDPAAGIFGLQRNKHNFKDDALIISDTFKEIRSMGSRYSTPRVLNTAVSLMVENGEKDTRALIDYVKLIADKGFAR
ncbi:hypothetical protein SAMN05660772_01831 [Pasteurella testudinis DSM 23072]|uniref:Uncharacterized protein n=1 Tax=Pasteurella testudinis DSM 23072 TaxID=1122938 RepID=A0A1W1UK12_9PAST|nr:hypothetical protein [Pasteurella testudinis]SMB81382.1 hypothetical protein SAMN05660772_01831 [Pasteurella testudinis DSM 23072]SUB51388.1 Uncharacterised protein [Pasteurella testudinis]